MYHNKCFVFPSENFSTRQVFYDSFPVFSLIFDLNKSVLWHPEDYLFQVRSTKYYCVGIEPLKDVILGAIFMRNYDILFERDSKKISITRANCSQSQDSIPFITDGIFKKTQKIKYFFRKIKIKHLKIKIQKIFF